MLKTTATPRGGCFVILLVSERRFYLEVEIKTKLEFASFSLFALHKFGDANLYEVVYIRNFVLILPKGTGCVHLLKREGTLEAIKIIDEIKILKFFLLLGNEGEKIFYIRKFF